LRLEHGALVQTLNVDLPEKSDAAIANK
jgi:hypothetical protein